MSKGILQSQHPDGQSDTLRPLAKWGLPDNHVFETRDLIIYSQPVTHTCKVQKGNSPVLAN